MENSFFDFFMQPNFYFWPLPDSAKSVLLKEEKWQDFFLSDPISLILLLSSINMNIKNVNFFKYYPETNLFFRFLKKLVKSKPQNARVLQEFNGIIADIVSKLSLVKRFDGKKENVILNYLNLLELMLAPPYRYLVEKIEIDHWINNFEKITTKSFASSALLSQFRNTLLLSFQSPAFIKRYPILIGMIGKLAYSLDKEQIDANELEAIKLFDMLGTLDHTLKVSQLAKLKSEQTKRYQLIQNTHHLIYRQFEPYVERNFLKFIVFKVYLEQSYINSTSLVDLCNSNRYQAQCKSDYIRFKDMYYCPTNKFSKFWITIKNNNYPKLNLDKWCVGMRQAEQLFITSMKENFGFKLQYNASLYTLHISDFKRNFLTDKFLFERDDRDWDQPHNLPMAYFPSKKNKLFNILMGSTYAYTTNALDLVHGYMYHLSGLFSKAHQLDLSLMEGLAELYSRGICSERSIEDLKVFVNDTYIFELFKKRQQLFYFYSLKWVAYLVNEQPRLLKKWINSSKNNNSENFYLAINRFIGNDSNIGAFVNWSRQQVNVCNDYLNGFYDEHQPLIIYLTDIKRALNQTRSLQVRHVHNSISNFQVPLRSSDKISYQNDLISTHLSKPDDRTLNQELKKGFSLPLGALSTGIISAYFDDLSLMYRDKNPLFPIYIDYGFKPFVSALVSANLNILLFDQSQGLGEKINYLLMYFLFNFSSVFFGQALNKKMTEFIQNKVLCFFLQILTWTLLWNPSFLFLEERQLLSTFFFQLVQGLSFKMGEEIYRHGKKISSLGIFRCKRAHPSITENNELSNNMENFNKANGLTC